MRRVFLICLCVVLSAVMLGGCSLSKNEIKTLTGDSLDYSAEDNWLVFDKDADQKVDLFYIFPTVSMSSTDETGLAKIDDAYRKGAMAAYQRQGAAFADYTNVYVPLYRQACFDTAVACMIENEKAEDFTEFLIDNLPRTDIYGALDYYFENINDGRPFILAGHSQGAFMCSIILSEYFKVHSDYLERMVACYAPGFPFSTDWIKENSHLKFATGETDTNCVIGWNTEGPDANMRNYCVAEKNSYCINPLNWKTDDTLASKDENKGAMVDGKIVAQYADAQIDTNRGVVVCTTIDTYIAEGTEVLFGDKSLHIYDFPLYFESVKENGQRRIEAFLKQ